MATLYLVMEHSRKPVAVFSFTELARDYADQCDLKRFRRGYSSTNQLDTEPYGTYRDKLRKLKLPHHTMFSDYSEEELLIIIQHFVGRAFLVHEVDWLA